MDRSKIPIPGSQHMTSNKIERRQHNWYRGVDVYPTIAPERHIDETKNPHRDRFGASIKDLEIFDYCDLDELNGVLYEFYEGTDVIICWVEDKYKLCRPLPVPFNTILLAHDGTLVSAYNHTYPVMYQKQLITDVTRDYSSQVVPKVTIFFERLDLASGIRKVDHSTTLTFILPDMLAHQFTPNPMGCLTTGYIDSNCLMRDHAQNVFWV